MSKLSKLMIVDDSKEDLGVLETILEEHFDLYLHSGAQSALAALEGGEHPDLILLDVEMPDLDGYAACKKIRENAKLDDIDVVFLSAHDTTDEILRGLEVGAIDYIVKPYEPPILLSKLQKALKIHAQRADLRRQASAANQLVQTVMTESGSLGNIVKFYRSSFDVRSAVDLMNTLVSTIKDAGLHAVVYFHSQSIQEIASTAGAVNTLENELLFRFRGHANPFVEKDARLFAIQKNAVLFIKNMPEDRDKRGSIKDYIMMLLEGANAKLDYFDQRAASSNKRSQEITQAIVSALNDLNDIQEKERNHKKQSLTILENMVTKVEASVFSMGLTEDQESELISILQHTIKHSEAHLDAGLSLDDDVKNTVLRLSTVAKESTG